MRGKAGGADRGNESRDQSGEGEKKTNSECVKRQRADQRSALNIWHAVSKEITPRLLLLMNNMEFHQNDEARRIDTFHFHRHHHSLC